MYIRDGARGIRTKHLARKVERSHRKTINHAGNRSEKKNKYTYIINFTDPELNVVARPAVFGRSRWEGGRTDERGLHCACIITVNRQE